LTPVCVDGEFSVNSEFREDIFDASLVDVEIPGGNLHTSLV